MMVPTRIRRTWGIALLVSIFVVILYHRQASLLRKVSREDLLNVAPAEEPKEKANSKLPKGTAKPAGEPYTRMLVMGKFSFDDTSWVDSSDLNVNTTIYIVDDPNAEITVPQNKGREAMVYLTYIIDHYDNLSDTTFFFHPHLVGWHNNVLLAVNNAEQIKRLSDARVAREGYMNARCHHDPGCPDWLHLDHVGNEYEKWQKPEEEFFTSRVWRELYGDQEPLPKALSQPCCAQFAVSRERIRRHPKSKYEGLRQWLVSTDLDDLISGRVLEYNWQYLFTDQSEFCPSMHECYCDGYGICFEGEKKLQEWLDILKQKEDADGQIDGLKEAGDETSKAVQDAKEKSEELTNTLKDLQAKAYAAGQDPKQRALSAGRPYKEGDGF
ncbi:hypothetical protein UCRPC4_g05297 [Phaeomoniella chlamydospora]|uniref:Uncharacterized protein n=1 Tax=Phaeomoniella chlamydospora TaxID=158046 RepID=A0A0G2GM37_PHACM|nr:hypothetical protein UCRPC4_g05297 [Phaeomoniella chlamydospora]